MKIFLSVGNLQQRRMKTESDINGHLSSFPNCEMTDLLKVRSKTPISNTPSGPNTAVLPSSLNASIHVPYAPGKDVMNWHIFHAYRFEKIITYDT